MFDKFLDLWNLTPDGSPIITHSSRLLPVRCSNNQAAMLKIAMEAEEKKGGLLMTWWDGVGAAKVLAHQDDALLLERAMGKASLTEMAKNGRDDEASIIICQVADQLHATRKSPLPELLSLREWFKELAPAAIKYGGVFQQAANVADELFQYPEDLSVLHGDIHHANILDFETHGWLAIDPKRLYGERGFDYANIFCNPDLEVAVKPGRLARQVDVVAKAARLSRPRLLKWILAYAGLSAAWILGDTAWVPGERDERKIALTVAEIALAEMSK